MTFLTEYSTPAHVLSIVALALAPFSYIILKKYYRSLFFLQLSYFYGVAYLTTTNFFSTYLDYACIDFQANLLTFCDSTDIVCSLGFPLSFAGVLAAFLFVVFIFTAIQKCCGKDIRFEPVFTFFKGFIIWFYAPIVANAGAVLITQLNNDANGTAMVSKEFLTAAILVGLMAIYPFIQLIGYKIIQKENDDSWAKWIEFFHWVRLFGLAILIGATVSYQLNNFYSQFGMIPQIIYTLLTLWKGSFKMPILQRIIFLAGECGFLALFYLYHYSFKSVSDMELDFLIIGGVMVLDALHLLIKFIRLIINGPEEGVAEVNPEETLRDNGNSSTPLPPKKVNKYEHDSGSDLQNSRDNIALNKSPSNGLVKKKK